MQLTCSATTPTSAPPSPVATRRPRHRDTATQTLPKSSQRRVSTSITPPRHAALRAHRHTTHAQSAIANFQMRHDAAHMACDLIDGLLEARRLDLVVPRFDGVAGGLEELLVEFVVGLGVAQHELEVLVDVCGGERGGRGRCGVRFLENLSVEHERRVIDEGHVAVGNGGG
jgi:hypothetical protein